MEHDAPTADTRSVTVWGNGQFGGEKHETSTLAGGLSSHPSRSHGNLE